MLTFEEAQARVLALAEGAPFCERVSVEAAVGRVLAEAVTTPNDLPPFDYSAMDGYAVASASLGAGAALPVRGESKTGVMPAPLAAGAACRIFTGAPIPDGADAVVMQEKVTREGDLARFDAAPRPFENVRRRGEDLARGAVALERGVRLRPAHLAVAATCDRAWLDVARRPVVTIVATGDELRAPGSTGAPGTIPESNTVALRAMAESAGAIARVARAVGDRRDATERAFDEALDASDLLVTVGGVSVGDHDLVRPALEAIGVTLDFWKVAMKPGKPLAVGRRGRRIVLGLPGNPASALLTFAFFGLPLVRALQGDQAPLPSPIRARVRRAFRHEPGRTEHVRVTLIRDAGATWAAPLANQASGTVTSLAAADGVLRIPAASTGLVEGDEADVFLASELGA